MMRLYYVSQFFLCPDTWIIKYILHAIYFISEIIYSGDNAAQVPWEVDLR